MAVLDVKKELPKWKRKTDNKLRGTYGVTDFAKREIRINKTLHKTRPSHKRRYAELLDTIVHEEMHLAHPKMHEKTVRKLTPKRIKNMTTREKRAAYARFRRKSRKK